MERSIQLQTVENFKAPTDKALHALWIIRNLSNFPLGNMQSAEDRLRSINNLASDVFDELYAQI